MPVGPRPAPPVGVARVAIQWGIFTHLAAQVFYLDVTHSGPVTVDDLKDIADHLSTEWLAHIQSATSSDAGIFSIDVRFISGVGTEVRYTGSYAAGGTGSAAVDDASACHVIDWVTSEYYRGGHPRSYVPGVMQASVTHGSDVDATTQADIAGSWNDFRNAMNAFSTTNLTALVMGTVRFASGGAWLAPPYFVPFTSCKYGNRGKLGSQRRRIKS